MSFYITCVMLCYMTYIMLYNIGHVMLCYTTCVTLCYVRYVMLYNICLCYVR